MILPIIDDSANIPEGFESQFENRFRGRKEDWTNLNSDIIITLGCSLTKKPQIQVSDY